MHGRLYSNQKTCPTCLNSGEDECHFLISCPVYKNRKDKCLENIIPLFKDGFTFLLSHEDIYVDRILGQTSTKSNIQ